jgi:tRNA pseudouridine38-40 synthase
MRKYTCHIPYKLDYDAMEASAGYFVGTYDFAAFCAAGGGQKTTVRTIYECGLRREANLVTLTVRGSAFLYNMVRIMAGTVLYAGLGKIAPDSVPGVIRSGQRCGAGKTMPPEGLVLKQILY